MKIVVCGSMAFAKEMVAIKDELAKMGIDSVLPDGFEDYLKSKFWQKQANKWGGVEGAKKKIKNNLIKKYYDEIKMSDGIIIANYEKNGIKNYIGGNSFLEMGFAFVLSKPIYVMNPLPTEIKFIFQELIAMQPKILKGDLSKIKIK